MTSASEPRPASIPLWIGTYPHAGAGAPTGQGEGVWRVDVAPSGEFGTPELVAVTPSPSFLALHPRGRTLYTAVEDEPGAVDVFVIDDSREVLEPVTSVATGGAGTCHVSATSNAVWAANYGGGSVARIAVDDDGLPLAAATVGHHEGSGPDGDRQEGPHAHFVAPVGDEVWSADLGTDQLVRYAADGAVIGAVALPPGTGPRHFVHVPGAVLVVGELDPSIFVIALGDEEAAEVAVTQRHPLGDAGSEPRPYPSHIALSEDGTRLFIALRGPDTLVTVEVDTSGDSVALRTLAESSIGGAWPRHFAVVAGPSVTGVTGADLLVVAQQNSGELTSLRVDRASGQADSVGTVSVPAPACVLVDAAKA